uniref:Sosondowah ankyrin repeat domain family member A n=1 Tax=Leptobrachium leishanense TaxID=445787 RepID=A0A8C5QHR4_9ANUR
MAVTQETVLDFLLEQGGSVKNSDLLRKFKPVVDVPDPQERANNRENFKTFVNNIAVVKDVEGVKVVVLRKKFTNLLKSKPQETSYEKNNEEPRAQVLPANQGDHGKYKSGEEEPSSHGRHLSHVGLDPNQENLQAEGTLQEYILAMKDGGAVLDLASGESIEEAEDSENMKVSVIDIASRIDNTGPAPVPKAWSSAEKNKGSAQKPFMLPLRYAQQSFEGDDLNNPTDLEDKTEDASMDGQARHLQPRSPHVSRRPLDDTGSKSPYTKRSSKAIKVSEETKNSDSVPLEASEHDWLLNSTNGRWNHILLGLLMNDHELADKRNFISGFTALHWASKSGNTEMIKILFDMTKKSGASLNVNVKSFGGYTPLHIAAIHDRKEVIIVLVRDYNAKVHIRDHSGKKPYQYLKPGSSLKIKFLLNDPQATSTEHVFPSKRNSKVANTLIGTTSALLGVLSDDIPFHDLAKGLKKSSSFNKFFTGPTGQKKKLKVRDSYPSIPSLNEEADEDAMEPVGKRRPVSDVFG